MTINYQQLANNIKACGYKLGFTQVGITNTDLSFFEDNFSQWLQKNFHGDMAFMSEEKRLNPKTLLPETCRIISVALPYQNKIRKPSADQAYIANYALGRDYHKLIRKRLQKLADQIEEQVGPFIYRAFSDSAPVLEKPFAEKAGLGWMGKNTNLIHATQGSFFFIGELFVNLPLPIDPPIENRCGTCMKCIKQCPTNALIAPYKLDARRCISYLTIEYKGIIPEPLRPLIGNHIVGCDECQMNCPWNQNIKIPHDPCFETKHHLDEITLLALFNWDEETFLERMQGSPIRRIGYECWQRNLAIALGNAPINPDIIKSLEEQLQTTSPLVQEHIRWALEQQNQKSHHK